MIRTASYSLQRSSGAPLLASGKPDPQAMALLASFDWVALEATPWGRDVDGSPRLDVPLALRKLNPAIKLVLYVLGETWLAPDFVPQSTDHSAFRACFDVFKGTNGFLYGTDGQVWLQNFRGNHASPDTLDGLGDVYQELLATGLFDSIFLDCFHTSIAWTDGQDGRRIDFQRAGHASLASMEYARLAGVTGLVSRLCALGVTVIRNGTGPDAGESVTFREGFGSLVSVSEARSLASGPKPLWLLGDPVMAPDLKSVAHAGRDVIVSCGVGRDWPPVKV